MGLQNWKEIVENLYDSITEEDLNNLIIYEKQKREEELRQQEERPVLQLPLPEMPLQEVPNPTEDETGRGVIIIEL